MSLYNNTTDDFSTANPTTIQGAIVTLSSVVSTAFNHATNGSTTTPPRPQLSPRCPPDTETERIIKIMAYSIVFVVSLIGNILIPAVVLSNNKMKKPTNYFILNMALSDLVVPLVIISKQFILLDMKPKIDFIWLVDGTLGLILCKLVHFLQDVTTAVSIFSLILITVDRFIAVVYPMKHYIMSNTISKIAILATWLAAMALHGIYLYAYEIFYFGDTLVCYPIWKKISENPEEFLRQYFIAIFSLLVIIPLSLMAIAYSVIIISLKRQSAPIGDSFSDRQKRLRAERERKVLRMAIAIILSFLVLWTPYNVYIFLQLFVSNIAQKPPCHYGHFVYAAFYCAYLNSAVNPCICFIFSQNFRQGLKQMLARIGIVKRQNLQQQATTQISMTMNNSAYEGDNEKYNR